MELKELDVRGEMAAVMEIIRGGFAQAPWNETWDDEAALREYIEGLTNAPDSLSLGLYDGARLAGVSLGRIKRWYWGAEYCIDDLCWYWGAEYCIDDLCVLPSMQGRGAGTEFVKLMDEERAASEASRSGRSATPPPADSTERTDSTRARTK